MSAQTCPRPKCAELNHPNAKNCKTCGSSLGLSSFQLLKGTIAERKRGFASRCNYCGVRCHGFTCSAHRYLVALDPQLSPPDPYRQLKEAR